jgi:hypothetical protein
VKSGRLYQSLVPLEGESLEQIFIHYLAQSEQMPAVPAPLRRPRRAVRPAAREAAARRQPRSRRVEPHHPARLDPRARRDARRAALRPPHAGVPGGADARVPPLCVEYHCPYDEDKVKDMLRGPRPARGRIDPRRAGRSRDPQRNVQPRVPLRREKRSKSCSEPLKSHDSALPFAHEDLSHCVTIAFALAACSEPPPPAEARGPAAASPAPQAEAPKAPGDQGPRGAQARSEQGAREPREARARG